jgi:hypothetical protein
MRNDLQVNYNKNEPNYEVVICSRFFKLDDILFSPFRPSILKIHYYYSACAPSRES